MASLSIQNRPEFAVLEMIVLNLVGYELDQLLARKSMSYEERWNDSSTWKMMLGEIVFAVIRLKCLQCWNCDRMPDGDPATWYAWHLDHLLHLWLKVKSCSYFAFTNVDIEKLIFEALKTRLGTYHHLNSWFHLILSYLTITIQSFLYTFMFSVCLLPRVWTYSQL